MHLPVGGRLPRPGRGAVLILVLAAGLACSGARRPPEAPDLTLPTMRSEAGLHLERTIDGGRPAGGGKLARWITGEPGRTLLTRPYGAAWDAEVLIVTDPGAARVVRIDARGRATASARGAFASPIGVAVCPAGILVTDSESGDVVRLDRKLQVVGFLARDLERPTGVACDRQRVYVAETGRHRVLVLRSEGATDGVQPAELLTWWGGRGDGPGSFNFPAALSLREGSLWVGDTLNFRVQRLETVRGDLIASFGRLGDAAGEMPRIKGLAVDASGILWVSDALLDRVALYRPDGTFLTDIGGNGSLPGEFSFPAGVAAHPDGRVAIVDSLNRRIQIFRRIGPGAGS